MNVEHVQQHDGRIYTQQTGRQQRITQQFDAFLALLLRGPNHRYATQHRQTGRLHHAAACVEYGIELGEEKRENDTAGDAAAQYRRIEQRALGTRRRRRRVRRGGRPGRGGGGGGGRGRGGGGRGTTGQ